MYQAPVVRVLVQHAPASLLLGFTALVLATCGGFIVGTFAGARPNGAFDQVTRALASVTYSAPVFWIGQVLIILIAVKLRLLPAGGFTSAREDLSGLRYAIDIARHLVLPAVTLSLPFMAVVSRVTRTAIADALQEPFVLAARARGIPARRVLMKHAAVSALVPVIALVGEHAAGVVAGAALTEAPDEDRSDQHDDRREVEQLREPVARVGDDDHVFSAADSSHRPRSVKHTMSTSMTICERVADRASP